MSNKNKIILKYIFGLAPIIIFIVLSIILYIYISPEEIVAYVGVENAYALMFVVAFIGGLSTFNVVPYYSVLFVLSGSGLDPLLLGLASGMGVVIGDSTTYFVGYQSGKIAPGKLQRFFDKVNTKMHKYPRLFPVFCFLYGSLSPLSNDFITISSGLTKYPFFKMMAPLALGNLVFNISVAYIFTYAYDFIKLSFFQ